MTANRLDGLLRRLLVVQAARSAYAWLPTAYFLFESRLGAEAALALAGVYYVAEVALEVPSSYASDRIGRRFTLLLAMLMLVAGGATVAFGTSYTACIVGQILVAASSAFVSGTDTALAYDHLRAAGRVDELGAWESRSATVGFASAALACVIGGAASLWWLGAGYFLSAAAAVVGLVAAWGLVDARTDAERAGTTRGDLAQIARGLKRPRLMWLFVFAVAMQVVNHVPLEFHQPYLAALDIDPFGGKSPTLTAGLVLGAMMVLGSAASHFAPRISARIGPYTALLLCFAMQSAIVWVMAGVVHPLVLIVIATRGVPHGLAQPLRNTLVHTELVGNVRATWFSLQTLVGSLAMSATLFLAARAVGGPLASLDAARLAGVLSAYGAGATIVFVVLTAAVVVWQRRSVAWLRRKR